MKLEQVQITNFRCIDDSTVFKVGQTTCLVGKNESGKTAILHALAKLNSADPNLAQFDKERDYPRKLLTEYDEGTLVLETQWALSDEDVAAVEEVLGPGALESKSVVLTRRYEGTENSWTVKVN